MSTSGERTRVNPAAAIPGGEVLVESEGFDTSRLGTYRATFDGEPARLVGASPRRVLAAVPESSAGDVEVRLETRGEPHGQPARLKVGRLLAEDLHFVANPAYDPEDGALYVTRSGSRGQSEPVSLFRLHPGGRLEDVTGEITNPTGLAFDGSGRLYVSSRNDGTIYRLSGFGDAVAFARNLGIATGIAFDRRGTLYVGDRTGTIYRVNPIGEAREWATLEASVAAYHLAFGPDGALYVTGTTVSSFDAVHRIDESGRVEVFFRGLGRPGGLAFDTEGNLYVAASYKARRGVVRVTGDGARAELFVAGTNVVGVAFGPAGDMVVATNEAIYGLALNIRGTLIQ